MEENNNQGLYSSQVENEEKSSLDFKAIFTILVLNWKWFVLSLVICLSTAAIYLRYKTPFYQSYVKLLIKDDDNNQRSSNRNKSALMSSATLGIMSNSAGIDNEMEILSSSALAEHTVKRMGIYTTYKLEGRIKASLLYGNQPVNVTIDPVGLDNLKMPIMLKIAKEKEGYHIKGKYTYVPKEFGKESVVYTIDRTVSRLPYTLNTSVGQLRFAKNGVQDLSESRAMLATIYPPKVMAGKYVGALSISQTSKTTTIAELVLTDEIPQRSLDYLKELVQCYNDEANDDKNEIAMRTEQFINTRLEKINNELGATESNIESAKRRFKIIDPRLSSAQTVANSDAFTQKLADMNLQLELLRSIRNFMDEPANKYQTLPSNVGLTDAAAVSLINNYNQIVMQRNRLLRSASETSPTITPLTTQLDDLTASIRRAVSQALHNAELQRDNIQQQYNMYSNQMESTPEQERVLTQIGRQQEVKSGLYLMLLQKREENSISLAATADKCKMIDEPQFLGKVSPKSSLVMLIALMLGLGIPAAFIFLINFFRYKIEGHEDVASLTEIPIIGDVAIASDTAKTKADIVVHENKNNIMEEVFRSIRSNVQFMLKETDKVVMFTSTTSGEGKTFTAANLAVSFALLGKKVLVVGLDIRKPRLSDLFELNDLKHGITRLLVHDNPTVEDLRGEIIPSGINKNLDILPAGPIPPNPTELVARQSLEKVFGLLREEYDYIVVDTAPVGLVADTIQIARVCDLAVYVCRADYTPKSSFEFLNSLNAQKKLPPVCIVINGIDMSKKKYGYYYGYGKYGKYGKYGRYTRYGSYGNFSSYGTYGTYGHNHYGHAKDDSIKH